VQDNSDVIAGAHLRPRGSRIPAIERLQAGSTAANPPFSPSENRMSIQNDLPSDVVGLTKVAPLSRRGFMTASAATAAGYTLAAGPVRAEVITTDTSGLNAGNAKVKVSDGEMPVYYAKPANAQNPPVILVAMEIFGLHEYIKDVTRRLAKLGALAVAPDYYFRKGVDLTKLTEAEIPKLMPIVNAKPDAELISDLNAVVEWAKTQGGDAGRLGILGFCRGGRNVWIYCANNGNVKAGVAFYGSLVDPPGQKSIWPRSPTELAPEMKAPVLGLYGEADQGIPVAQVEAMKAALQAAGKKAEFKIYPSAPHGFHADYRPSYRKDAADDAWNQMTAWFKANKVLG
jgi:carboxymethylenebutenolidase